MGRSGEPIVALLPPQNIKVRAFVPETRVGSIQYGETVRATVDGVREAMFIAMKRYRQTLD